MSQRTQQEAINASRNHIDDQYNSKIITNFNQLTGVIDGENTIFYIPQSRLVVVNPPVVLSPIFPQLFNYGKALVFGADYDVTNPDLGQLEIEYGGTQPPKPGDELALTTNWLWMNDIEMDHHLNRAANEVGFTTYFTLPNPATIAGGEALPIGGTQPSDVPDGLYNAICLLAAGYAARAIANRYSIRYDSSAGDQSFSPSQVAKSFTELAKDLEKRGLEARDDHWKGQGRQFYPSVKQQGYILPNIVPNR